MASSETRPTLADEMYSGGSLEQRARALCSLAADKKAGETVEEEEEEEEKVSDSGSGISDDGDDTGHAVHRRTRRFLGAGTRPPWEELDKQRLLAWRRENKSWKWLFRQFLDRTEGAIRMQATTLQKARSRRLQTVDALVD